MRLYYRCVHNFDLKLNWGGGLIWKFYCNLKKTGGLESPKPDSNFAHELDYFIKISKDFRKIFFKFYKFVQLTNVFSNFAQILLKSFQNFSKFSRFPQIFYNFFFTCSKSFIIFQYDL